MSIRVTCPNGHHLRVKNSFAGKSGYCPYCRAKVRVPAARAFQEDDVMSVLGPPPPRPASEPAPEPEVYVHQEPEHGRPAEESGIGLAGSSVIRRAKLCLVCRTLTSFAFSTCTRCGTPLVATYYEGPSFPPVESAAAAGLDQPWEGSFP